MVRVVPHVWHVTREVTRCTCFRIAELAAAEGRAVVVVMNKWDLVSEQTQEAMKDAIENVKAQLRTVSWAKVIFTSAVHGAPRLCSRARPGPDTVISDESSN